MNSDYIYPPDAANKSPAPVRRPEDFQVILGSEDYQSADPEKRLNLLSDHARHSAQWLVQRGMDPQRAITKAQEFFEAHRENAIDNGIAPYDSAANRLVADNVRWFWNSVSGAGELLQVAAGPDLRTITPETEAQLLEQFNSIPEPWREGERHKWAYRYGIGIREDDDGNQWVEDVEVADNWWTKWAFVGSQAVAAAVRGLGGHVRAAGEEGRADAEVAISRFLPENPRFAEKFWTGDIPGGLGQAPWYLVSGAMGGLRALAGAGATQGAARAGQSADAKGATDQQRREQIINQAGIGLLEGVGLGGRLPLGKLKTTAFGQALQIGAGKHVFAGFREGTQEAVSGMLTDLSELRGGVDEDANPFNRARRMREFAAGAVLGGGLAGLERTDAELAISTQRAINAIQIDVAESVLSGDHPAMKRLDMKLNDPDAKEEDVEVARAIREEWVANAREVMDQAATSDVQTMRAARDAGLLEDSVDPAPFDAETEAAMVNATEEEFATIWQGMKPADRRQVREWAGVANNAPAPVVQSAVQLRSIGANPFDSKPQKQGARRGRPAVPFDAPGRIMPDPLEGGQTKRQDEIIFDVSAALGANTVYGGESESAYGSFDPGAETANIALEGDLDTTGHELAHQLDHRFGLVREWAQPGRRSPYDAELEPFWQFTSRERDPLMKKRAEGVAEWVRAWLVNPEAATRGAPEFAKQFERLIPAQARAHLRQFGDDIRLLAGSPAGQRMLSNVRLRPKGGIERRLSKYFGPSFGGFRMGVRDWWAREFLDSRRALRAATEYIEGQMGRQLRPSENAADLADLHYGGHEAVLAFVMRRGMIDGRRKPVTGGGLDWLTQPFEGLPQHQVEQEYRDTISYLLATRVIELAPRLGKSHGIIGSDAGMSGKSDLDTAQEFLADLEANPERKARVEEAARRYREWSDATLRFMRDKGLISDEKYQGIVANNVQYVALHRLLQARPGDEVDLRGVDSLQAVKGSQKLIENPYYSLWEGTRSAIERAHVNDVKVALTDALRADVALYQSGPKGLGTIGQKVHKGDQNAVVVWRDGRREHWRFQDDVLEALNDMDHNQRFPAWMTALPRSLHFGITRMPAFAVRNGMRDFQSRMLVSRSGQARGLEASNEVLAEILQNRGRMDIDDLQRYGGDMAGPYAQDVVQWTRAQEAVLRQHSQPGTRDNSVIVWPDYLQNAWDSYESMLQVAERFGRVAEFKAAHKYATEELGYDEFDASLYAAKQARELIDFAVAGRTMRAVNQLVPFSNAAVQGLRRNVTALQEDHGGFIIRFFIWAVAPTLAARAIAEAAGYDDELREQPAYVRDLFWNFKVADDTWIRIPRNFEVGVLAGGVDRMLDVHQGKASEAEAFHGYVGSVIRSMAPVDESAIVGQYGAFAEAMMNRDLFRQRYMIPPHESEVALDAVDRKGERIRSTEYASRFGKAVQGMAEAAGLSNTSVGKSFFDARKVDYLARNVFGTMGDTAIRAINTAFGDDGRKLGLRDTGVVVGSPAYQAVSVQRVYDITQSNGLSMQDRFYDPFHQAREAYFEAETKEERQARAEEWVAVAKEMLPVIQDEVDRRRERAESR